MTPDKELARPSIHIHAPQATAKYIKAAICLDCKKRTRMIQFFTPWYGFDSTCIRCGRTWCDGEWMPLEFCRNARQSNIEHAKNKYRKMPPRNMNHFGLESI